MIGLLMLSTQLSYVLTNAEGAYAEGVRLRGDSRLARPQFQIAARLYDRQWNEYPCPSNAVARLRAYQLAGDNPRAMAACHDGLAIDPANRELQAELNYLRSQSEAKSFFPRPWFRSNIKPWHLLISGFIASVILAFAAIQRFTVDTRSSRYVAIFGIVLASVIALSWFQQTREAQLERNRPLAILLDDQVLRTGVGTSYSSRLPNPLSAGSEVRILYMRSGWFQVILPTGEQGWLPAESLRRISGNMGSMGV